jgi:hypothetical protein
VKKVLSLSEIKGRYDSEWVLWHSKDRDEVYRKAREIRPEHCAIVYTGKLPDNVAVVL